ncbi:MAG: acyl-CoA/acyl-ACP dehydrogenase [Planctomycetaceae bacterium]|nr:acyl-CoA/acyl-ACP dehydrogenase [Planctomycetaceae bacterium]
MAASNPSNPRGDAPVLPALPSDEIRSIMWRLTDRQDLWQMVRAARLVARGPVARLVAAGQRDTCEWTAEKGGLLDELDRAGVSAIFADPEFGGPLAGPKSLVTALAAYELAWVDGGAATCLIALGLALQPIISAGTDQQRARYLRGSVPAQESDEPRKLLRGAFCLTEPLPYAGVDTGVLSGKVRVVQDRSVAVRTGMDEPLLHVQKRGRFTNNMDFANFVVVAVASDDPLIRGTCMVILEEEDPGTFDRGTVTHKLVHQLTSTRDPVFDMQVPASRIVGGYTIQDGVIVPNYNHAQILEAVFSRTRVPAGVMTGAKLLSSVEPIIRYQRERFRGGEGQPGTPRHDLGLQTKEDAVHRLVDIWAAGEAACSLGFAAARHFDSYAELEKQKQDLFAAEGIHLGSGPHRIPKVARQLALEYLQLCVAPDDERDDRRLAELDKSRVIDFVVRQAVGKVLSPATKLWNTGQGAMQLRQAVSLMGGYGITQDCPGFLPQKWMDSQLEATYEGPEAVQRRQLIVTMTSELFLAQFRKWTWDMGRISAERPGTGACTLAAAMDLWSWTLNHLQHAADADGQPLYRDKRQGATFPMADAICWLLASYYQILDTVELETRGTDDPHLAGSLDAYVQFFTDLCHVQAARAAGEVARICSELVFGYNRHPSWEPDCGTCMGAGELDDLEGLIPGISVGVRLAGDVVEEDGTHLRKAGPCVRFEGLNAFVDRRSKLDGCLTGARLAKDRAGYALSQVAIPDKLDYPN